MNRLIWYRGRVVVCLVAIGILLILITGCRTGNHQTGPVGGELTEVEEPIQPKYRCPLDGSPVEEEGLIDRRPLAVMVENNPSSRPQSGLTEACIVYEFPAEGNITRFLSVYLHGEADIIGPIRSARPYFLDKVMELDALYAHCGQSPQAEIEIPQFNIMSINELKGAGAYFWRDNSRRMPHNLYSSVEKLRAYAHMKGWEEKIEVKGFQFEANPSMKGETVEKITLNYPGKYQVIYSYSMEEGIYLREMAGKAHLDRETNQQIKAQNIVVIFANRVRALDSEGRLEIDLIGEGDAEFFVGNQHIVGSWKKDTRSAPTYFLSQDGQPIKLMPGQTWVQVVSPNTGLVVE